MNDDRERLLAIILSRLPLDDAMVEHARRLAVSETNWRSVIDNASALQVEPVVLGNLRSLFAVELGAGLLAEVTQREQLSRANALAQTLRVVDMYKSLAEAGIEAMVLKGPAISTVAYDDASRRMFSDIDLVIKRDDLSAAQAHLESRGYRPLFDARTADSLIVGQHALEFEGPGPHVELHWSLLPRHLSFAVEPDDLWREAVTIEIAGAEVRTLAPHHLFLYLCAHGAKHAWMYFRWVCDIAQLSRRLTKDDAKKVIELADRIHARKLVALALRIVRDTFGEEPSPFSHDAFGVEGSTKKLSEVAQASFNPAFADRSVLPVRLARVHPYAGPLAYWLGSRERLRDRLICVTRFVFESAPGDTVGVISVITRPLRLAMNLVRRAGR